MYFETTLTHARVDAMTEQGLWRNEHLIDRFAAQAARLADEPLFIDRGGVMTWAEAAAAVDELTKGLAELGLGRGDVVQIQLPNRREFPLAVLAVERLGAVVNPVAPIFRANEVSVMSALARPSIVITIDSFRGAELAAMHLELGRSTSSEATVVVVADDPEAVPADSEAWTDVLGRGRRSSLSLSTIDHLRPSPNEVCEVMFTSGTTGQPKGVMHTQNTINATTDLYLDRVAADCSVFHMASTLAHQTGYLYGIRAPISAGGCVVYQEIWDAAAFAALIDAHGIEASTGATPFLADLLAVPGLDRHDLSSFTAFVCAGATIPQPVLEAARDRLPCTVMPGWGMTETGLSTIGRRSDGFEKLQTDGAALAGQEVRVVDDAGQPLPPHAEGNLEFRGSEAFVGYIQGRELSEACWHDGWFDTGDRAVIDDDGYISISGRTKDIVIRGGENIPVKEVEDVLLRHPAVHGVAVIAVADERLGETACAVVVAAGEPPTLPELTAFLDQQQVTRQFWPESVHIVDEFPMTPSGKIQKYRLRQLVDAAPAG